MSPRARARWAFAYLVFVISNIAFDAVAFAIDNAGKAITLSQVFAGLAKISLAFSLLTLVVFMARDLNDR